MQMIFALIVVHILRGVLAQDELSLAFPDGFSIGAGTSAYQIEGAWNVSDKAENVWDYLLHKCPSLSNNNDTGDIACDSYHKYKEDVQIAKNMGLHHYRFSISWSRVLPTGTPDIISKDGIQYYKNLIDELLKNGIEPFVTLHHFDDLQLLVNKTGGWANESMVEYFAEYSRVMFRELGPKVKFWSTFNEVNIFCKWFAYLNETTPDTAYRASYLCAHNVLKAHARAYHIYDEEFRSIQHGQIGLIISSAYYIPKTAGDTESTDIAFDFNTAWVMNPVYSKKGGYPEVMKQRIAENSRAEGLVSSRLPEFSDKWINYIQGTADYLGLNHYITTLVEPVKKSNGRWYDDAGVIFSNDPSWKLTAIGWGVVPESMSALLRKISKDYNNPPVYILENGASEIADFMDIDRIAYLYSYMKEVLMAKRDGCDVRAYTVWSFLDNYEWFNGYAQTFGLIHVDFKDPNRKRTPKLSSHWLKIILSEGKLLPYKENLLEDYGNELEKTIEALD
ncbi:myrosinase 1 [Fopius arisanus]|uniref:beta-glucosidase n=1 Tax=Fopius arisanus TaxID=64838 RepID=A0A9R1U0K6_9HYME|nr:PREDICTED: myrosinase 1-like [Fopius arisanus]